MVTKQEQLFHALRSDVLARVVQENRTGGIYTFRTHQTSISVHRRGRGLWQQESHANAGTLRLCVQQAGALGQLR